MSTQYEILSQERKSLQQQGLVPDWYSTPSWQMFKSRYMVNGEKGVKERFENLSKRLARHLPKKYREEYDNHFRRVLWKGILSPSSPVLANTATDRGCSVSCGGQYIGDSVDSFYGNLHETAMLSKNSFGTSGYFGDIRPRGSNITGGGKATGLKPVVDDFFTCASKISHGGMRRGSFAAYVPVDHPDFDECISELSIDHKDKNYGWVITDEFTSKLKTGEPEATRKWKEILKIKLLTGKGYLFFPDKANRHRPESYVSRGLNITASNLCTEIMLHSSDEYSFSCILSSINLLHWDEIKDSNAVFIATVFLDCLCSEFIEQAKNEKGLEKVVKFTEKGRAIGLGTMGFSTYLQSKMIPYESLEAQFLNVEIWKHIHDESLRASKWLATILGEPEWCEGLGVRNTHRTTSAPTKSTAGLMGGMSESTFPDPAMVFTAGSAAGELDRIPPQFLKLLKEKGKYTKEVIENIVANNGSVQQLDFLSDHEKLVFKNAFEIDQWVIFRMAKARQKYICQGQSLNFFIAENENTETLLSDLMSACVLDEDILSQYYIYTRSGVVISGECVACSA